MTEKIAELCIWMTTYTEIEVIAISLACLALACLLGFVGVRLVQVMILGEVIRRLCAYYDDKEVEDDDN